MLYFREFEMCKQKEFDETGMFYLMIKSMALFPPVLLQVGNRDEMKTWWWSLPLKCKEKCWKA